MIVAFMQDLGVWSWFVVGALLLAIEIVVPGTFILWLGLAAVATGLVVLVFAMSLPLQFLVFGLLSVIAVVLWWNLARGRKGADNDRPMLNRRAERHLGREFVLETPIVGGHGRVGIDDTTWRIAGPDCPAGTRVRVAGTDGALLIVEVTGA
jgi:membrane protein implicated in regulation of membrane protease activity